MIMSTISGCGKSDKPVDMSYMPDREENSTSETEIDLTELLSAVNDCVLEHCGTEYTLTTFAQYEMSDGSLTDDLSEINKESLEDGMLTVYVLFQIPQEGKQLQDMEIQHYIKAVVDIYTYKVLSLSESDVSEDFIHLPRVCDGCHGEQHSYNRHKDKGHAKGLIDAPLISGSPVLGKNSMAPPANPQ